DVPSIGRRDEPVNRHLAAYVAKLHVECEPATVRKEGRLVEPIPKGPRNGMPLMPGRALNSSTEPYGQYRMLWPFTFISMAMLPTDGRIETVVCVRASSSCTTSPARCNEYGCANAAVATVRKRGPNI